ncbi:MAG: serine/threonine-protein kinase [Lachnospiraceae bacterium]|nr:serine/threonine-protein kinase [Lachnospiraceae bacterium]
MLEIGTVINGTYKILNKIGQGGMSVVYLAMNERANKQWAIKELKKDGSQNYEVIRQGLIAEAEFLKKLRHPNLPCIVDIIENEDTFLIVMDYIEGRTLYDLLQEYGALPQEEVIVWAKQICNVLIYLHSRTPPIIYRDMKPSNIMRKPDGNVVVIDFGTAREYKNTREADTTCLGTQGYAAPEQFGGQGQTDARTDIYCLGATLYHLVTGHDPAKPPYEMYPIRIWDDTLSAGLEEIILKCTQKNPKDRYQNGNELLYALEHYYELEEEYRKVQKKKILSFFICTGLVFLFGMGALFGNRKENQLKARSYESYLEQAMSLITLPEKKEYYTKAISLNPADVKGYLAMLEDYLSDEEFSSEEVSAVTEAYSRENGGRTNLSYLEKNKEGYGEFCFQLGIDYFFKFQGTTGKTTAQSWFQKVLTLDSKVIEEQKRKRVEIYNRIGSYYESLGKSDLSGETENVEYNNFFEDLSKLNQNELADMGNQTTAITLYNEIAVQISSHAFHFMLYGITGEKMEKELKMIENRMPQLSDDMSESRILSLKNNIEAAHQSIAIAQNMMQQTRK